MRFLRKVVDERFWHHRQRSTSVAGILSAVLAISLFEYRYWIDHRWNWDLLAIALTFVLIKMGIMAWYYITD